MIRLATLALLVSAFATTAPAQDDAKKVLEALQGEWKFVSFMKEGRGPEAEKLAAMKLTVAGDKMTVSDGKKEEPVTIVLDPKATPAAIDLKVTEGKKEIVVKGIYKLDKNTLTICYGLEGGDRPKEFKAGDKVGLMVVEKIKK